MKPVAKFRPQVIQAQTRVNTNTNNTNNNRNNQPIGLRNLYAKNNNTNIINNGNKKIAACGNCGRCNLCCLPTLPCGNCGNCSMCCTVQVPLPFTDNCTPNNNVNAQFSSVGVCVQGVDLGCATPNVGIIDSCQGNMINVNNIPEGEPFNTVICSAQPIIGIPQQPCAVCQCTPCVCAPRKSNNVPRKQHPSSGAKQQKTAKIEIIESSEDEDEEEEQSSSSQQSTTADGSTNYENVNEDDIAASDEDEEEDNSDDFYSQQIQIAGKSRSKSAGNSKSNHRSNNNNNNGQKQIEIHKNGDGLIPGRTSTSRIHPSVASRSTNVTRNNNMLNNNNNNNNNKKKLEVEFNYNPSASDLQGHGESKSNISTTSTSTTNKSAGCTNCNRCANTNCVTCPNCNFTVPCPCATGDINRITPCNCNYIALTVSQTPMCDSCGSQTANITPNNCCCPCGCATCANCCANNCACTCACANCTCNDNNCNTTCPCPCGCTTCANACASNCVCTCNCPNCTCCSTSTATTNCCSKNPQTTKSKSKSNSQSQSQQQPLQRRIASSKPHKSEGKKSKQHKEKATGSSQNKSKTHRVNNHSSKQKAGCTTNQCNPNNNCNNNNNAAPQTLQSVSSVTNACNNVNATATQIVAPPCGEVPCPPTNPIFTMPSTIACYIQTWYQSCWDFWGMNWCVNDIPLKYVQVGGIGNAAPSTGVVSVAIDAAGVHLAVAYETGNNQVGGIDIYQVNCGTWNKIQTIVPMPTNPICGANACAAFTIAMAFSDNGSILAVGCPLLGSGGTGFIFQLCGCAYQMVAEFQPAAQAGGGAVCGQLFGYAVAVAGNGCRVFFGAPSCNGCCANGCQVQSGSVASFRPTVNCTWIQEQLITINGLNQFTPFLVNGNLLPGNPYELFANNPCGEIQPDFGRSLASDVFGNNLIVGGSNMAFVYGNINPNQVTPNGGVNGSGSLCVANAGPFELIATLQGNCGCANINPNLFDQGIAVAISGDGLTCAVGTIAGSNMFPIVPAGAFIFRRNPIAAVSLAGALATAYTQEAFLTPLRSTIRAGCPVNTMGLWLSYDGTYCIFGDPMYSVVGSAPTGCIAGFMREYCGWTPQGLITGPIDNSCIGSSIAVNRALSMLFACAPLVANAQGNTGRVWMYN